MWRHQGSGVGCTHQSWIYLLCEGLYMKHVKKLQIPGLLPIELLTKKFSSPVSPTLSSTSACTLFSLVSIANILTYHSNPYFSSPVLGIIRNTHSVSSSLSTVLSNNQGTISKSLSYLRSTYFFSSIQVPSSIPSLWPLVSLQDSLIKSSLLSFFVNRSFSKPRQNFKLERRIRNFFFLITYSWPQESFSKNSTLTRTLVYLPGGERFTRQLLYGIRKADEVRA